MDVYFQSMASAVEAAIMQAKQGAIKSQKVIASLIRLSSFLKNSLIRRYTLGNMHHLIGRNVALLGNYVSIHFYRVPLKNISICPSTYQTKHDGVFF